MSNNQWQQGGYPQGNAGQQGGYSPQGSGPSQQGSYPYNSGGQQGSYPQQGGYPQQGSGYPQQGGYPQQNGAGGYVPGGQQGYGGNMPPNGPQGYGPQGPYGDEPKKKNLLPLWIVLGVVVLVGLGVLLFFLLNGDKEDKAEPAEPSETTSQTTEATPSQSAEPEPSTATTPAEEPTTPEEPLNPASSAPAGSASEPDPFGPSLGGDTGSTTDKPMPKKVGDGEFSGDDVNSSVGMYMFPDSSVTMVMVMGSLGTADDAMVDATEVQQVGDWKCGKSSEPSTSQCATNDASLGTILVVGMHDPKTLGNWSAEFLKAYNG